MDRHPFQSLCSYIGSFPPNLPVDLLSEIQPRTGPILDPFCGSGTTLLEAKRQGRDCIGVDLNPLAIALSRAKVADVTENQVKSRLTSLATSYNPPTDRIDENHPIRIIYHDRTLRQLTYLKQTLRNERADDRFILGVTLGIMHGKFRENGTTQYLSIDMPNTFSMSPSYVRDFVEKHNLTKKPIDVFGKLRKRIEWLFRKGAPTNENKSRVLQGDATELHKLWQTNDLPKVGGVITSPPYLKVLRYGAFNWIRLWLLGHEPRKIDSLLDSTSSLDKYLSFIASFLISLSHIIKDNAPVALVVGDVDTNGTVTNLAGRIYQELGDLVPYEYVGMVEDKFDTSSKTTRIWGDDKKGNATKQDRILIMERII